MADNRNIKSQASNSNSNTSTIDKSIVEDYGCQRRSCGYCKSGSNTSIAHGLWAYSMTVHDYQALLDRGWRRSGCYLYKPVMEKMCCPSYTIRLKANDFVPSKEQVRVAKRMQRFLHGSLNIKNSDEQKETSSATSVQKDVIADNPTMLQSHSIDQMINDLSNQINSSVITCIEQGELTSEIQFPKASVRRVAPNKRKLQAEEAQDLVYTSNISFQIAAALRRVQKNACTGNDPTFVAEMLSNHLTDSASAISLSVKACNGHINFYSTETQTQADAMVRRPAASKSSSSNNPEKFQAKRQNLEIRLKRSTFDPEEYELYRKYQIRVHNDRPIHVTESSYKRFLIDSPLIFVPPNGDGSIPSCGFGSFHQQYLVNGKLIAVGVIDILPKCLSSKYLFWDPDFAFLSLGKYSALQEINWVKESQTHCTSLQYYYLGYYIHSCNKMRYKATYHPSELLCPLRYEWVPFDIAKRLLDRKPYVVLSDFATLQNEVSLLPNATEDQIKQDDYESNDIHVDEDEEMSKVLLPNAIEDQIEQEDYESNDILVDMDEEMSEVDFEYSDDDNDDDEDEDENDDNDSDDDEEEDNDGDDDDDDDDDDELVRPETTSLIPAEMRKDIGNIVIGSRGRRRKYKDIRQDFGPNEYLESQLDKYVTAVGTDLSERMIYTY